MKVSDESIVAAVMGSSTNLEAAKRVGLSERQFYKRLQTESVQGKLRKAQSELLDEAIAEMRRGLMQSIQVIFSIMTDSSISPQVRLNAASQWHNSLLKLSERQDVTERIEKLETLLL